MILDVSQQHAVTIGLWIKRKIGAQEIGVDWNAYLWQVELRLWCCNVNERKEMVSEKEQVSQTKAVHVQAEIYDENSLEEMDCEWMREDRNGNRCEVKKGSSRVMKDKEGKKTPVSVRREEAANESYEENVGKRWWSVPWKGRGWGSGVVRMRSYRDNDVKEEWR